MLESRVDSHIDLLDLLEQGGLFAELDCMKQLYLALKVDDKGDQVHVQVA